MVVMVAFGVIKNRDSSSRKDKCSSGFHVAFQLELPLTKSHVGVNGGPTANNNTGILHFENCVSTC